MNLTEVQKTKIYETLGTASMAWSETPKGIFDSNLCDKLAIELIEVLESTPTPERTAEEIELKAKEVYGNDHYLYAAQRDGFVKGYQQAMEEYRLQGK
jgi:hypothetical protein